MTKRPAIVAHLAKCHHSTQHPLWFKPHTDHKLPASLNTPSPSSYSGHKSIQRRSHQNLIRKEWNPVKKQRETTDHHHERIPRVFTEAVISALTANMREDTEHPDIFWLEGKFPIFPYSMDPEYICIIYLAEFTKSICGLRTSPYPYSRSIPMDLEQRTVERSAADIGTSLEEPWGAVRPHDINGIMWSGETSSIIDSELPTDDTIRIFAELSSNLTRNWAGQSY